MTRLPKIRAQRGSVIVETVIVLPLLLFLTIATVEVTNAFVEYNTLTKMVRNSARHVSAKALLGSTGLISITPQLLTEAQNLVVYGHPTASGNALLTGLTTGNVNVVALDSELIQVSASYQHTGILGATLSTFGYGSDLSIEPVLSASIVMRVL